MRTKTRKIQQSDRLSRRIRSGSVMYRGYDNDVETQSLSSTSGASASFCSAAESYFSEGSSYDIESEVGRDALIQICCSSLSRLLDFPDSQFETLLGTNDEQATTGEDDGGTNVARCVDTLVAKPGAGLTNKCVLIGI